MLNLRITGEKEQKSVESWATRKKCNICSFLTLQLIERTYVCQCKENLATLFQLQALPVRLHSFYFITLL